MRDLGRSDDPRVQAQLDRLSGLSIQRDTLGLDAIRELLSRLGDPHKRLPPVFHVAGTNGKGSTCAFLRAMLEAEGYTVHVTTSPHLVRYNERFRIAGQLIEDARLAELLEEIFDAAEGLGCSFFEITIAAAFVEFARVPADACVVEVGLGGRLDATNVLEPDVLAACGIAALGIDHERFLLAPEEDVPQVPMARIAFEKAGIAKKGVPLVTLGEHYPPEAREAIAEVASSAAAPVIEIGKDAEREFKEIKLGIGGAYQPANATLASAMLRSQDLLSISDTSVVKGAARAYWPARMQQLSAGPLTQGITVPVFLDGAHNANAAQALGEAIGDGPLVLVSGILKNRGPGAIFAPFKGKVSRFAAVPVAGHEHHDPKDLCVHAIDLFELGGAYPADGPEAVFQWLREKPPAPGETVLILGSLYLAGEFLKLNDEIPD